MEFNNVCNCEFQNEILETVIKLECDERNIKPNETYKIYLYNTYPAISIKHDKVRVHQLIGKHLIKADSGKNVVHHIDGNKLNNDLSNLEKVNSSDHSKIHNIVQFMPIESIRKNALAGAEARKRKDVAKIEVMELREKGLTYLQIAERLHCGYNTVWRRLKLDWSE